MQHDKKPQNGSIPMTLAGLRAVVENAPGLSRTARIDIIEGLATIAQVLAMPIADTPADPWTLRCRFGALTVSTIGMDRRTWCTAVRQLERALKLAGLGSLPRRQRVELAAPWDALVASHGDRRARAALTPLARYCGERAIPPDSVTQATYEAFAAFTHRESLHERPSQLARDAGLAWNGAVGSIEHWPKVVLCLPKLRHDRGFSLDDLPASFTTELEDYLARLTGNDLLDQAARRPISPITRRNIRQHILQVAGIVVGLGRDPATLTSLGNLVEEDVTRAALNAHFKSTGQRKVGSTNNLARTLLSLARHGLGIPADDRRVVTLRKLTATCKPPKTGLTAKNRARLRPFTDPLNVQRLLRLPFDLADPCRGRHPTATDARVVRLALSLAIVTNAPMRVKNLSQLKVCDISRTRSGHGGVVHLLVDAGNVKNKVSLEFTLPERVVALLDLYLTIYRPLLTDPASPWLLPDTQGGHKTPAALAAELKREVELCTGLTINAHLFRHLTAYLFLKEHPGEYETVRQLLGHTSVETTRLFYCGLEKDDAFRRYDALLDGYYDGDD